MLANTKASLPFRLSSAQARIGAERTAAKQDWPARRLRQASAQLRPIQTGPSSTQVSATTSTCRPRLSALSFVRWKAFSDFLNLSNGANLILSSSCTRLTNANRDPASSVWPPVDIYPPELASLTKVRRFPIQPALTAVSGCVSLDQARAARYFLPAVVASRPIKGIPRFPSTLTFLLLQLLPLFKLATSQPPPQANVYKVDRAECYNSTWVFYCLFYFLLALLKG